MYNIIYSDPPWHYNARNNTNTKFGAGVHRYSTMKTEEICRLPVQNICEKNCALFLWTTFPRLDAGLKVINAWGFDYKTLAFVWIKLNKGRAKYPAEQLGNVIYAKGLNKFLDWITFFGTGYYTKSNPEVCLLGIKGSMKPVNNSISNVFYSPLEKHSKKPDVIRDKIVQLFGDLPRVEMFARESHEGWDSLGNEIDGRDIKEALSA